ncbi:MAG: hypothetical protein FJW40_08715 [Acidobacteria bacterium]|nr:hypothetical protein [Acidobacteriota bacterium]
MSERRKGGGTRGSVKEIRIEYDALPSQAKFHNSTARFKGFSGPVGSGKSEALCHEALLLALANPGRVGLLGAPTYPMLRDTAQPTLMRVLTDAGIGFEFNRSENYLLVAPTKSKILLRSVDEFERLRGTNLAWFGLDELTYTHEEAWTRLEGRLRDPQAQRLCGFAVWTPKGFDWVYRRFIRDRVDGYETIIAAPHENRHILEKIPDYYERLKRSYTTAFYEQEVLGVYRDSQRGRVYNEFDRLKHFGPARPVDPARPLLWALDFNVNPMCSVVAQLDESGVLWVLDEVVLDRASTNQACVEFLRRYGAHPGGYIIYGDASSNQMRTSGPTDQQIMRRAFLHKGNHDVDYRIPKTNPLVRERVALVNSMLMSAAGDIKLYIADRCENLARDLEEVLYKDGSAEVDKDRDPRLTHLSDALGYLAWQECRPKPPIGHQEHPLV